MLEAWREAHCLTHAEARAWKTPSLPPRARGPGGVVEEKAVLDGLRLFQAHGSRPDMEITIDQFAPVWTREDVGLVSWHRVAEVGRTDDGPLRQSVLFRGAQAPAGVHWLHIHETWMAAHAPLEPLMPRSPP